MRPERNRYTIPFRSLIEYAKPYSEGGGSSAIMPNTPYETRLIQAATQNTWYTVADITGEGIIGNIVALENSAGITLEVRITIDSSTPIVIDNSNSIYGSDYGTSYRSTDSSLYSIRCLQQIEFSTDFKIEIRTTDTGKAIYGVVTYGLVV